MPLAGLAGNGTIITVSLAKMISPLTTLMPAGQNAATASREIFRNAKMETQTMGMVVTVTAK